MPLSRLSVRSADLRSVFFHQCADRDVAVHRLEHFQAGAVEPHERQVVIERGEPPLVFVVLVGDQVGNVPGQEPEGFSREVARLVNGDGWLHAFQFLIRARQPTRPKCAPARSLEWWSVVRERCFASVPRKPSYEIRTTNLRVGKGWSSGPSRWWFRA